MPTCAYVHHTYTGAYGGEKRVSERQRLELQKVVSCYVDPGSQSQLLSMSSETPKPLSPPSRPTVILSCVVKQEREGCGCLSTECFFYVCYLDHWQIDFCSFKCLFLSDKRINLFSPTSFFYSRTAVQILLKKVICFHQLALTFAILRKIKQTIIYLSNSQKCFTPI